ncbi:LysR family transcriptional regulator [Streptomyces sp. NPDC006658]|uniref:LysR family transcriptional regulator n=1 Tax=Streptomyces sp. NPDC006658 TaxID=3156900 RepID=UPI0033FF395F
MASDNEASALPLPAHDARRDPSTHQLRLFLVLAHELHFGRAAARMFMTQPAFSQQISALEKRIGVLLIERSSRKVELTAAGVALLPEIRSVVAAVSRLRQAAGEQARDVSGHLALGAIGGEAAMPYTHAVLTRLRATHPHLTYEMHSLGFAEQFEVLARGEADAVFLLPPLPPGFQSLQLSTGQRVACMSADDPLANQKCIVLAQLADHTVLDMPPRVPRAWWDFWTVNPRPNGKPVRYGMAVTDVEAMLLAVARDQGIVFLPAAARHLFPRPGVAYLNVTDLPPFTVALAWLPQHRSRPTLAALRQAAHHVISQNQPAARHNAR